MSAAPNASFGGQERSGETHCCHVMRSVDPNDALFTHGAVVALPFRAAARSAKKRSTVACGTVNGLGLTIQLKTEAETVRPYLDSISQRVGRTGIDD